MYRSGVAEKIAAYIKQEIKKHEHMRVQFYGIGASGKTTLALQVAALCKPWIESTEYIPEYFKSLAFVQPERPPDLGQQFVGFGKQLHLESQYFANGARLLVCDMGLLLCAWYTSKYHKIDVSSFIEAAQNWERLHPTINVFLQPLPISSEELTVGRWGLHTPEERTERSEELRRFLEQHLVNPIAFEVA